jgi:hypothetical protein
MHCGAVQLGVVTGDGRIENGGLQEETQTITF